MIFRVGKPMYYGAKPKLFEYAKQMRRAPTEAEKLMWLILTSDDFLLYKFRQQHPLARYIADFYSHSLLLVIEVDGGYHKQIEQSEVDTIRDEDLKEFGITVLRFTNQEVLNQKELTIEKLKSIIAKLPH